MITQIDILKIKEELKDTFATKDDLKESVEQLVELITDGFSRMDKAIKKISDHDGILNNFERRLDHLEDKVFA